MAKLYDVNGNLIEVSETIKTEPYGNDIPNVYLYGTLPTSKAQGELNIVLRYVSLTKEFTKYATAKVQGDSSANYAKKNFTIKLYDDESRTTKSKQTFLDWKSSNKFVMKANWIDHSHARNIVTARLWTQVVKSRSDFDALPTELTGGHMAIDGFAVKVFANGVYQGLYTWNVPKDGMYGLDDGVDTNCIIQGDKGSYPDSELFRGTEVSGIWSDELHDSMPSVISTAWTNVLSFVSTSSDEDFVANLENYFDKQSLIDAYIFKYVGCIVDNLGKNQTYFTYDAVKWYTGMYDLDGTWGLPPVPTETSVMYASTTVFQDDYTAVKYAGKTNYLYERVGTLLADEVKTRYNELRETVLSENNIIGEFEKFIQIIPPELYAEDYVATTGGGNFTGIPMVELNNVQQIRQFVIDRLAYVDSMINV